MTARLAPGSSPAACHASRAAVLVLVVSALAPASARAQSDPDPWWAPDKALHLSASAVLASGGYVGAAALGADRPTRLLAGGVFALTLGVVKELADLAGLGQPSFKDLAWDAIGTALGLVVTWAVDVLFFSPAPAARSPEPGARSLRAGPLLRACA